MLTLLVAIVYGNSLHGEFIFDDLDSIPRNPHIRSLRPLGPVLFPPRQTGELDGRAVDGRTIDGRPLLSLSFALNYAWHGLDVRGYHVTNVSIHLAAALTFYGIVRRTLVLPRWAGRFAGRAESLALAAAALWAVHPLQTESVTYIVQRAESLVGLFYLLVLYCAIRSHGSSWTNVWLLAAVVFCALGMGVKEVMATAPLMVLLYDRVFLYETVKGMFQRRWRLYAGLAATWVLLAAIIALSPGRGSSAGLGHGVMPKDYAQTQLVAIAHYLRLTFFPHPLVLDYGDRLISQPALVLPAGALIAALLAGTVVGFRFQPWIGFLGVWFFAILAPTSSIVPIVTQTMAEHRIYLSLAAVTVLVVVGFDWAWRRRAGSLPAALGRAPAVLVAIAIALCGWQTWRRNADYRTAKSIWLDTRAKVPDSARPHCNLVECYAAEGRLQDAMHSMDKCLELKPNAARNRYNRATLLVEMGRFPEALEAFDRTLEIAPDDVASWQNRGAVHLELKNYEQAIHDFSRCLELNPRLPIAYRNRATAYLKLNRTDLAEADIRRYLELGGTFDAQPEESQ